MREMEIEKLCQCIRKCSIGTSKVRIVGTLDKALFNYVDICNLFGISDNKRLFCFQSELYIDSEAVCDMAIKFSVPNEKLEILHDIIENY